ncbi:PspC domain-containing protein [Mucilaginibacter boryungensis]|uniref:PspC domain-containing protein n=1 Tax=Mucilaginibacter boryungensis TaxID=768480 RepID=A0ABR9XMW9_9SPHI|nr:PspC domain-containing protein [Mucilaginibacter boryungensis]MBE9668702.1 PspC domain-containing protein [Mucilaginibacter boryungensis]
MNKTIIININGIVFHIEEDAYEVLKNYMTDVKRHFLDSADSLEITTDIENRIAEMFNELLAQENKQVIVEQDVQTVISQMGTVEDFASADEDGPQAPSHAAYTQATQNRRLFRDPDDHLAAGVCAGIANYFDIQPVWIRLAFAVAFCFFGTGLFLYIILWIVVPKAITRADRMAMKGEPLDLQGFKRNFEYELKGVQGSVNNLHSEAKPFIYKTRDFAGDFFDHLRSFLGGAGKVLIKLLGIAIMLACIGFTIALIVGMFTFFAYGQRNIVHVFPFSMLNHEYNMPFMLCGFLLLFIPLIGMALLASRLVFNRTTVGRTTGFTLLAAWLVSLFVVVYYSIQIAAEFRSGGKMNQTVNIVPNAKNTYYLKVNDVKYLTAEDSAKLDLKHSVAGRIIVDDNEYNNDWDDNNMPNNVSISIERSDVTQPVLVESFRARGRDYADALQNAQDITYHFTQKDSVLTFDRHIQLPHNKAWRGQEVRLTLKVPLNSKLVIDREMDRYLDGINVYDCQENNKLDQSAPAPFIMTEGGLQCKIDTLAIKADTTKNEQ